MLRFFLMCHGLKFSSQALIFFRSVVLTASVMSAHVELQTLPFPSRPCLARLPPALQRGAGREMQLRLLHPLPRQMQQGAGALFSSLQWSTIAIPVARSRSSSGRNRPKEALSKCFLLINRATSKGKLIKLMVHLASDGKSMRVGGGSCWTE